MEFLQVSYSSQKHWQLANGRVGQCGTINLLALPSWVDKLPYSQKGNAENKHVLCHCHYAARMRSEIREDGNGKC